MRVNLHLLTLIGLILLMFIPSITDANTDAQTGAKPVATIKGESIYLADIDQQGALEVYQAEKALYELRLANLKNLLIGKLIRLDPRSEGLSDNAFIERYVANPLPVTDADVNRFIIAQRIPAGKVNANLKGQAKEYLINQQIAQQLDRWYRQQMKKHNVAINLAAPSEPRFKVDISSAPYRGDKNAPVTIVEFSDFQCPYCAKANDTLRQLRQDYGDKIKIVYKHFPLNSIHPQAGTAAQASICAQQQGMDKFWQLHDLLFANFRHLSTGSIKDYAKQIGLDYTTFESCLNSGRFVNRVNTELQQGASLGVESTPAFFINGRFLKGAVAIEIFKTIIDEELAKNQ